MRAFLYIYHAEVVTFVSDAVYFGSAHCHTTFACLSSFLFMRAASLYGKKNMVAKMHLSKTGGNYEHVV